MKLTIDGGAGDDTILGSQGADVLLGGDGDDFIFGDNGDDVAFLGAGDDVFQWNPGDGNDTVEGQDGVDTMLFFGANIAENIDISANGGRVLFFRDIANVTMDLNDVETIDFRALGGVDNIVVGDLSGTDTTRIDLDLRGPNGGGDGAADSITVNGTNGADVIAVTGDAGGVSVFGLQATVNVFFPEVANDRLTINALDGDDVINASSLEADGIQLTLNGGRGRGPLHRQRRRRPHQRRRRRRHRAHGRGRRHLRVEPGRRQRYARGPGRLRHDAVQRRQRRREDRHLGQRRAGACSSATSPPSRWT